MYQAALLSNSIPTPRLHGVKFRSNSGSFRKEGFSFVATSLFFEVTVLSKKKHPDCSEIANAVFMSWLLNFSVGHF